jgi:ABC-2 type transport system ATP-binding protein
MAAGPLIEVTDLAKTFRVLRQQPGFLGGVRSLFSRDYRAIQAVAGVSFAIAPGELIGYLGPNGSGKSTTIKMLTGILHPSGGHVTVGGLVPHRDRSRNSRQIGVVFGQRSQLNYDLPVRDTFALLRRMYAVPPARYAATLAQLSDLLGVEELLDRQVRLLSLGERMRCELIASLLHEPPILFLDEPTIGLDVVAKERMRAFIRQINQERGTTILLTTHDMVDIEQLCQRVIIIDRGAVIYDGNLAALKRRFGRQRTVVFSLLDDTDEMPSLEQLTAELAGSDASITVERREDGTIAVGFNPQRTAASDLTRQIVNRYPVADLAVADADLSAIIGEIYAAGGVEAEYAPTTA